MGSGHFLWTPQEIGQVLLCMVPSSDLPGLDWESEVSFRDPRPCPHTCPTPCSPSALERRLLKSHCGGGGQQGVLLLPSRLSPKSFQDQRPINSRKGLGLGSCSPKGRRRTCVLSALQVSSLLSAVGPCLTAKQRWPGDGPASQPFLPLGVVTRGPRVVRRTGGAWVRSSLGRDARPDA